MFGSCSHADRRLKGEIALRLRGDVFIPAVSQSAPHLRPDDLLYVTSHANSSIIYITEDLIFLGWETN